MKTFRKITTGMVLGTVAALLSSCAPPLGQVVFEEETSQLQTRSIQSRTFDTADPIKTMRAIVGTLMDLDFVIDQADSRLGLITATRLHGYQLHITVMVHERSGERMLVRASGQVGFYPIKEPEPYQEFFASLEKELFLTAHQVD